MNDNVLDTSLSLGKQLTQARQARELSENEVAQQLLFSKQIIVDLENDNYSRIVAPVYAKGYLKAYAQFLGLPVDAVLASFEKLNVYSQPKLESTMSVEIQENKKKIFQDPRVRWLAIGGLVLIIILFVLAALPSHEKNKANNVATSETVPVVQNAEVSSQPIHIDTKEAVKSVKPENNSVVEKSTEEVPTDVASNTANDN